MQIGPILMDWHEAIHRSASGTLEDGRQAEDPALIEDVPEDLWYCDSFILYMAVAEAYEAMLPYVSEETRDRCLESLSKLIQSEQRQWLETPDTRHPDNYFLLLSPATVKRLTYDLERIDLAEFKPLFDLFCPDDAKEIIQDFDDNFAEYLQQWSALFRYAASKDKGILMHVG